MARYSARFLSVSALIFTLLVTQCYARSLPESPRKEYIVVVECAVSSVDPLTLLKQVLVGAKPEEVLLYVYNVLTCGFATRLTESEAKKLEKINGVVEVIPNEKYITDDGRVCRLQPIEFLSFKNRTDVSL